MPVVHYVWDLRGTPQQNRIIEDTLNRTEFPWHWLRNELVSEAGKSSIPVEWADLSRYAKDVPEEETKAGGQHGEDGHHSVEQPRLHSTRAHNDGKDFHIIGYRSRVLGLAWYSGKVTMEETLVNEPELAGEVFLSEGAHMVDFFYMNDEMRVGVWNAFHPDEQDVDPMTVLQDGVEVGHGHSWFDVGGYYSWVGEAFMGGFVKAFSDLPVTINFDHPATPEAAAEIRRVFGLGEPEPEAPQEPEEPVAPEPTPEPEPQPEPEAPAPEPQPEPPAEEPTPEEPEVEEPVVPEDDEAPFFALDHSKVFHDSHKRIRQEVVYNTYEAAVNDGKRPCKVCKPRQSA